MHARLTKLQSTKSPGLGLGASAWGFLGLPGPGGKLTSEKKRRKGTPKGDQTRKREKEELATTRYGYAYSLGLARIPTSPLLRFPPSLLLWLLSISSRGHFYLTYYEYYYSVFAPD